MVKYIDFMSSVGVVEMYVLCIDSRNFLIHHQDYI